ncbi:PQQ-binding-like beta-propeller repeat protein [Streptomyces sp. VRA16 Mangrove soil]|uniref:outer membrane protein assembly factor BamB family protein n=1 Tax=Streptomyces sp. VRA16 Mangrove soil TaxID=2817434 RepID=UPI001A9D991A|nr:PQQ-binding-like beta-propeller repeat protein [Streptomyces sp. VRA16 Mangrove soil]MBO1330154.1 PQQ-binding-like beta-propeller repeat protein [Streptomyces sp. VRA16 Mangrove soil]
MNSDQLDRTIRDVLHDWTPDSPAAPAGIADRIVRRRRRRNVVRAAGTALGVAGITVGAVFVTGGDGHKGTQPPTTRMSTESRLLWRTTLPSASWDACTLGSGAVYCRGAEYDAIGVDARTGTVDWKRAAADPHSGSTPSGSLAGVRDGVLYTYADHDPGASRARTDLVAIDLASRQTLWKHVMADDSRDAEAAVRFNGWILANTPSFKSVAALDDRTGRTLWTYKWKQADCTPASLGGAPYLVCSPDSDKSPRPSSVIRLDPKTGAARTVATVKGMTTFLGTDGDSVLLGGLAGGQRFFSDPGPATFTRVDTGSGKVTRHRVDGIPFGKVADGKLLAGGDGTAVAYSAEDGRRLWSRDLGLTLRKEKRDARMRELPSAAAVDLDRRVAYYLDPSGHLVGLDLDNGTVRWRGRVPLPVGPARGGIAPELMLSGHTLIGQTGGALFRIEPRLH